MRKIISMFIFVLVAMNAGSLIGQQSQKTYKTNNGNISIHSETPAENIDAQSSSLISVINPATKNVACVVMINTFKFKNSLMQEHFNERYMESDKYPKATFSGVINEDIDLMKAGTYNVTVTGKFTVHGVEQTRTMTGVIKVDTKNKLTLTGEFKVKLVDHKIEVPKLVFSKIAEEILVKVNSEYALK